MRRLICVLLLVLPLPLLAREVSISILETTDLHGHILPTADYAGHTNLGGLARCATTIKEIRRQVKNCLLVDAGDTMQGTAVGFLTDGQVMVKAFNHLHYDAWVWGNHEFDWGLTKLANCAERSTVPILNANLQSNGTTNIEAARILSHVSAFRIVECDGVKVGIIGLNTPGIPNWSRPRLIAGFKIADSIETLKVVVPAVKRAGAQVLVLVCHQGFRESGDDHANQVNAIARNFPELDVILAGHTHRNFPEFKVGNVLYCQPEYFGLHLARADLVFDTEKGHIVRRQSQTILMDGKVALDQELLKVCGSDLEQADKTLKTVLGEATANFDSQGAPKHETAIHGLMFESIAAALHAQGVNVDVIVHGVLEPQATIKKGPILIGDVWRLIPYENSIGVMSLTVAQLREVMEENIAAYDKREFRGVWGLNWSFDPTTTNRNRLVSLQRKDGTELCADDRLTVAFNSFELASGGARWQRVRALADDPSTKLVEYDLQTRQSVIDYIRSQRQINPSIQYWWHTAHRDRTGQ